MAVNCCVPGCVNYSAKSDSISYHKLPQDTQQRKAWLERIRRTNMHPHEVKLRVQIIAEKCKRRLKEDAIPSEFCCRPPAKRPRLSSENRLRRRSHKEVSVFYLSFFFMNKCFNHGIGSSNHSGKTCHCRCVNLWTGSTPNVELLRHFCILTSW